MPSHPKRIRAWQARLLVLLAFLTPLAPDFVHAAGSDTPIGDVLCTLAGWFTGNAGKGLASLVVLVTGTGMHLGKVSWGQVVLVVVGVSIVFGASGIASALGVGASGVCVGR